MIWIKCIKCGYEGIINWDKEKCSKCGGKLEVIADEYVYDEIEKRKNITIHKTGGARRCQ